MSGESNRNPFQWMIEAGVEAIEVLWLRRMQGSPKLSHPVAMRRVQEIYSKAAVGMRAAEARRVRGLPSNCP